MWPDANQIVAGGLKQRILRNDLRRLNTLAQASATDYPFTWDGSTAKDPDTDILTTINTIQQAGGINPNHILYGRTAWNKRIMTLRKQNIPGGYIGSPSSKEALADLLTVDQVAVSKEVYSTTKTTKAGIVASMVLGAYVGPNKILDPSNIKRFWSKCEDGSEFRVWIDQHMKYSDVTVEHYSQFVVVSSTGLFKSTIT